MISPRILAAWLGLALGAAAAGCSPAYVARAGWEEAKILQARRPIREVVHDTSMDAYTRARLRLVEDAREYARLGLGLDPKNSFESYATVEHDTLQLVVSAAPEFQLTWKTWWFPIVGHVPYKGFFQFESAFKEARRLNRKGYDTWVRPTSAFSTLGWLPDPVLSTTLESDSVRILETVVHEIVHTTYFPRGQAQFNESFANFVGHRAAIRFFCVEAPDEALCRVAQDRWHDVRVFGRFFQSLVHPLQALYDSGAPADEMRARKRAILEDGARRFAGDVRSELRSGTYADLDASALNNAWLLSRLLYYERLEDFESAWNHAGSLRSVIEIMIDGENDDPWATLDVLLSEQASR